MVQAKWAESLAAGLLCAGLAMGQSSENRFNADLAPNAVVTFRENGTADRKCKVVRRWRDASGRWAYELEMLDSHERQVIYEPESAPSTANGQSDRARASIKTAGPVAAPLSPPPDANFAITPAAMASQTPAIAPPGPKSAAASSDGTMEAGLVERPPVENDSPDNEKTRHGVAGLMGLLRERMHQAAPYGDNAQAAAPGIPANEPNAFSQPVRQARFPGLHHTDEPGSPYAGSAAPFSLLSQRPAQRAGYLAQSAAVSAKPVSANLTQGPLPLIPVPNVNPQDSQQLIGVLQNAGYPSQREWAAEMLSQQWTSNAEIVPALSLALRQDPAESVRKACATCLAKIQRNDGRAARYNDRPHQ
jgi:hypothetical protein